MGTAYWGSGGISGDLVADTTRQRIKDMIPKSSQALRRQANPDQSGVEPPGCIRKKLSRAETNPTRTTIPFRGPD